MWIFPLSVVQQYFPLPTPPLMCSLSSSLKKFYNRVTLVNVQSRIWKIQKTLRSVLASWSRQNFSLQYQYNIKQTSDENKEKYQLGDYKLIQYQILQTNIRRTVWQTVRRITNEILGVKGLTAIYSLLLKVNLGLHFVLFLHGFGKPVMSRLQCIHVCLLNQGQGLGVQFISHSGNCE